MNPDMYERVRDMFASAGLSDGYISQLLLFEDTGKISDAFMVFAPGGGTELRDDLSSDYYVDVAVIGAKDKRRATAERVKLITEYVKANQTTDPCLNYIEMMGVPGPMPTTEGRIVFQLRFRCVYGE